MTIDYMNALLDFHYWARDRVLVAVESLSTEQYARPMGSSFSSIRDTLTHIYQAEWIWYTRWNGVSPSSFPADELPDVATLRERWSGLESDVRALVQAAGNEGLGRVIEYRLMSGKPGASPLWQMIAHVVNHASYHRGQVTTMLRQLGAAPAQSTDMIAYFREKGHGSA
jgi:uncharacterized damage-inducible protein DinB